MRTLSALCLAASLAGCATITRGTDPQAPALAGAIRDEADGFYAALADKTAPECDLDHNAPAYDRLAARTAGLHAHVAATHGSAALERATRALAKTLANARESHALASADATDPAGTCLAAGAIMLNRDAITRASAAIAASQTSEGDH